MLDVQELHVAYGSVHAVHGISLSVSAGGCMALLGANGAGKTSAVEAIAGLLPTRAGKVTLDGQNITGLPASTIVRRGLALVPQWRELFPAFSVEETLAAASSAPRGRPPLPVEQVYDLF